jgi:CubicO group peptidase (beta-lactamase class C family)
MDGEFPESELCEFVDDTLKLWHVPGLAVAVVKDDQVILCEGFGLRNIEDDLPVTPDTLFPIASCTKAFAAMSVGLLVEAGKLDWDKPVREYLPTFKLHDTVATERMTPRDLLTHRSGLPRHDLMWYASNFSRREIFDRLRYLEPNRDFRYTFQYQNIMYMVAGLLVAEVAGMSWEQFVQTHIFDKLGMSHTNLSTVVTQQSANFATPHLYRDGQLKSIPFFESDGEKDATGPAGNIVSCVSDMAKWLQTQINGGQRDGQQLISETNLAQMHTPHIFIDDPEARNRFGYEFTSYGLGWGMRSHKGQLLVQHGGAIDGFAAYTSLMPRHNIGVVVLANADAYYNPTPNIVTYTIYDRLLGLEPTDWNALIKPFYDEQVEAEKQSKEKSSAERKPGANTSHPIEAYLGDYDHPGYGVVSIREADDQLQVVMNDKLTLPLEHYHYDIFEAHLEKFDYRVKLSFSTDIKGNVAQVAIQMEPMVKEVVFARMPDRRLTDRSFLEKFVGVYDLQKTPLTVALKEEKTLTATVQGQPEYVLVPYQGTEFNLQGLSGFSIEFKEDEKGQFTQAIVTQPGMVFVANRRE